MRDVTGGAGGGAKRNHLLILPTFYLKFLRSQIPKAQKDTDHLTVFFALLG